MTLVSILNSCAMSKRKWMEDAPHKGRSVELTPLKICANPLELMPCTNTWLKPLVNAPHGRELGGVNST